ncbi:MAG: leucine-rich repeat protein [Acholeplasmatales bacterium]|nr:leucine-rich repeat protein [Acholeplasmatales bacterium]
MTLNNFLKLHKDDLRANNLLPLYEQLAEGEIDPNDLTTGQLSHYLISKGKNPLEYTQGIVPIACFSEMTFPKDYKLHPDIKIIKQNAFEFVDGMTRFFAPEGLEEIEINAFYQCEDLTHLYLPSSLFRIPVGLFTGLPKNRTRQLIIHTPINSPVWEYCVKWNITRDNLYRY